MGWNSTEHEYRVSIWLLQRCGHPYAPGLPVDTRSIARPEIRHVRNGFWAREVFQTTHGINQLHEITHTKHHLAHQLLLPNQSGNKT